MTLEMAVLHASELVRERARITHDPRFRFYHGAYPRFEDKLEHSTWAALEMVSVTSTGRVVGFLGAEIHRATMEADGLAVARFDPTPSLEWARDMGQFIRLLFVYHGMHSVRWHVIVGSPHERSYDRLAALLGGRCYGRGTGAAVLPDGIRADAKYYEVLAENLNRHALDRLAGEERHGNKAQGLARGRSEAGSEPGDPGPGDNGDHGAGENRAGEGGRSLQPVVGGPDGGVGRGQAVGRQFRGTVTDSGGGKVEVLVDRDTLTYPAVGRRVHVYIDGVGPE